MSQDIKGIHLDIESKFIIIKEYQVKNRMLIVARTHSRVFLIFLDFFVVEFGRVRKKMTLLYLEFPLC